MHTGRLFISRAEESDVSELRDEDYAKSHKYMKEWRKIDQRESTRQKYWRRPLSPSRARLAFTSRGSLCFEF